MSEYRPIAVAVKPECEFLEIATDFGSSLELLREALSNSYDWGASRIRIHSFVEAIDGQETIVIEIEDNGIGMSEEVLEHNFWDLGNSYGRGDRTKIGEKGHGTKIYLRSQRIVVTTHHESGSFEAVCERPFQALSRGALHTPKIRPIDRSDHTGTLIRIEGYNNNDRSQFRQSVVKDYLYWFTVLGSFRDQFPGMDNKDFTVQLKCLDVDDYEELRSGHVFAAENRNLDSLWDTYAANAAEYFVKKYTETGRLPNYGDIEYQIVVYVEGDKAKRAYNPLLRDRTYRPQGYYKVADRYGIWLAKDWIPVQRVNDWVSGFGSGSNSIVLLHGFVNCQNFRLTANRGSVVNTEPGVIKDLKEQVARVLDEIDSDLHRQGLFTLQEWQNEERTLGVERADFERRKESIASRKVAVIDGQVFLEPQNEAEVFACFVRLMALRPGLFPFELLDYNTNRGIDILARNKTETPIADCQYWYVEMKYLLRRQFNHAFSNLRWVVCWDFASDVKDGTAMQSIVEGEDRELRFHKQDGKRFYYLETPTTAVRISVIRLREFIEEHFGATFRNQQ